MGQLQGKPESQKREAKAKFHKRELNMIRNAFNDLILRSVGKTVTKVAFLRRFPLPGILGERIYTTFVSDDAPGITWAEFIIGMRYILRGTAAEKDNLIFKVFDIQSCGFIMEEHLVMMLYSMAAIRIRSPESKAILSEEDKTVLSKKDIERMVTDAFDGLDVKEGDRELDSLGFIRWLGKYPEIRGAIEGVFLDIIDLDIVASEYARLRLQMKSKSKAHILGTKSCVNSTRQSSTTDRQNGNNPIQVRCHACGTDIQIAFDVKTGTPLEAKQVKFCILCGQSLERKRTTTYITRQRHEGYLTKIGSRFRQQMQRWFVIRNGFLHEFHNPKDVEPMCSTFLPGCFVETFSERDKAKLKYGIEIIMMEDPRKSRLLYAQSIVDRDAWIKAIREHAINEAPWGEYKRLEELGVGRFSSVVCAEHLSTGERYAMKIIEKLNLDEKEQEALHTEISVLQIVHHPNILSLKHVYETRRKIFLITNLVSGGDLYERLEKEKVFSESRTCEIIKKLLGVVSYLHARGIVHRDLKPENILCTKGSNFDIILGDFGLSKFASPNQVMKLACGTPAYVAPEVWSMSGYTSKVDLWSVGVMLYFFLSGRLPFTGKDRKELQQSTVHSKVVFTSKSWEGISEDAIDLTKKLLAKKTGDRIDAKTALQHPWFEKQLKSSS